MPPPLPPSSSSCIDGLAATANIRVLVRVRPHNSKELNESGSIGRSNVLTLDSSHNENATITVKGSDENESGGNGSNGNLSSMVTSSSSL